jgi:CRISPR-associated protein Cas5d
MNQEKYEVEFEIAGPAAMFARPDTGSTPISYPVPTFSAAKGMFESVAWLPHVYIQPTKVEVCRPIRFQRYVTNYGGPLRSQVQLKKNAPYQLIATILVDVCYRIYGEVRAKRMSTRGKDDPRLKKRAGNKDYRAILRDRFDQRLKKGQTYYTPCLGWKEFVPSYFGPLREGTKRDLSTDDLVIPSFLRSMWEHRQLKAEYVQNWRVVKGVLSYVHQTPAEDESNAE